MTENKAEYGPIMDRCQAYIHVHGEGRPRRCGRQGIVVMLQPSNHERSVFRSCYCAFHSGESRSLERAKGDWRFLAPYVVGGDAAVVAAGTMQLDSTHTTITLRHEGEQRQPESWRLRLTDEQITVLKEADAWKFIPTNGRAYQTTGKEAMDDYVYELGNYFDNNLEDLSIEHRPERRFVHSQPWIASLGTGPELVHVGRFVTEDEAVDNATEIWRVRLARRVDEIVVARGGTLSWGLPIEPPAKPIIIVINRPTDNKGA